MWHFVCFNKFDNRHYANETHKINDKSDDFMNLNEIFFIACLKSRDINVYMRRSFKSNTL